MKGFFDMRKMFPILLIVLLGMSLTGCASSDYKRATELFNKGEYAEAQSIFETLGEYKDSADLVTECQYQNSLFLIEKKDYDAAKPILESLAEYKDSATILEEIDWLKFTDYITKEGKVTINNKMDEDYTVTLEMQGALLYATYSIDAGLAEQTFLAMINRDDPTNTTLTAKGSTSFGFAYMEDKGSACWDITTYKQGDGLKRWEEYTCTGRNAYGVPLPAGTTGLCYDTITPLRRLTSGIRRAIIKSDVDISMSDLGFLAY